MVGNFSSISIINYRNTNRLYDYISGQLLFGCDTITLIKHKMGWEIIRQRNQTKINKDNIREIIKRVDHD